MLKEQEGKCAVCSKVPENKLNIDHCHKTGKIRQLLCRGCNTALGHVNDNIEILEKLILYIKKHDGI